MSNGNSTRRPTRLFRPAGSTLADAALAAAAAVATTAIDAAVGPAIFLGTGAIGVAVLGVKHHPRRQPGQAHKRPRAPRAPRRTTSRLDGARLVCTPARIQHVNMPLAHCCSSGATAISTTGGCCVVERGDAGKSTSYATFPTSDRPLLLATYQRRGKIPIVLCQRFLRQFSCRCLAQQKLRKLWFQIRKLPAQLFQTSLLRHLRRRILRVVRQIAFAGDGIAGGCRCLSDLGGGMECAAERSSSSSSLQPAAPPFSIAKLGRHCRCCLCRCCLCRCCCCRRCCCC